ncbi:type 3 dihydrofolate reductase [Glaciecola sp. SC05]|uniref:type 3 dihydrofolate reductase n=1 Tax=Glaciecola sp. SC05 TaxID=1987355 RepID=UPI003529353B
MKISLIAAMASNRVIGKDNQMPWHLSADLRHFKAVTLGKPVIMGRKTYESIGKALPGRQNIVISRQADYKLADAEVVTSCEEALALAKELSKEVMIIGGGKIYAEFLPKADYLYLTHIDLEVDGDTQFPDWQSQGSWKTIDVQAHKADEKNAYDYEFVTLERC